MIHVQKWPAQDQQRSAVYSPFDQSRLPAEDDLEIRAGHRDERIPFPEFGSGSLCSREPDRLHSERQVVLVDDSAVRSNALQFERPASSQSRAGMGSSPEP